MQPNCVTILGSTALWKAVDPHPDRRFQCFIERADRAVDVNRSHLIAQVW